MVVSTETATCALVVSKSTCLCSQYVPRDENRQGSFSVEIIELHDDELFRAQSTSTTNASAPSITHSSTSSECTGEFEIAKTESDDTGTFADSFNANFGDEVASDTEIVEAVKEVMAALAVSDVVTQVERSLGSQGWSIVATLPRHGARNSGWLLEMAHTTLLEHAEQSLGFFILEGGSPSFTLAPSGFTVVLRSTRDMDAGTSIQVCIAVSMDG